MLSALVYLHSHNVVHRNIRPSNILVEKKGKWDIKLIDFDFAKVLPSGEFFYKKMGNLPPFYDSPEVFRGQYNEKCDIWSTGIILYILLSGKMPFNAEKADHKYIAEKILIG
jgi:calcium-dependent protein kinase